MYANTLLFDATTSILQVLVNVILESDIKTRPTLSITSINKFIVWTEVKKAWVVSKPLDISLSTTYCPSGVAQCVCIYADNIQASHKLDMISTSFCKQIVTTSFCILHKKPSAVIR